MPQYVDGFVIPIPKKNLPTYRQVARVAGKVWKEHGALQYFECVGDDLNIKGFVGFPRMAKVKPGETVLFSWAVFPSRAKRDKANAAIMKDPRIAKMADKCANLFECKRMAYGGFKTLVVM